MKLLAIFISLTILISCNKGIKGFHLVNNKDKIQSYKSNDLFYQISKKWYVNDSVLYYYFDDSIFKLLKENKKKFEYLSKTQIIELFGKPNVELFGKPKIEGEEMFEYYMNDESNYTRIHTIRFFMFNYKIYNVDVGKRYYDIE
jgi:hypothetical protein